MIGAVLAGALGLVAMGEPPPFVESQSAPDICWSEPRWVLDDRVEDPAKDPVMIGRAIAAQVLIQKGSNGWRGRSFTNRIAEHVAGDPRRGSYVEVQFHICDKTGRPLYDQHDPYLEDFRLDRRRTGRESSEVPRLPDRPANQPVR